MIYKQTQFLGIVEGFFSKPLPTWTCEQRLTTLMYISKYAPLINSYLYCPKNDPFVTKKWNTLYPTNIRESFKRVINFCNQNQTSFIYGLNPSLSQNTKYNATNIIRKFSQLQSLGCKSFCLLYDDIPLSYSFVENIQDISDSKTALFITSTVNAVYNYLKLNGCSLWLCSPDYFLSSQNSFIKTLSEKLNKDIPLIWTGPQVFVKNITSGQIRLAKKLIDNRELILWLNYPVNDYPRSLGAMNLGGFPKLNPKSTQKLLGIFINPMRESCLNFPLYNTFNQWIKTDKTYNRTQAYSQAVNLLLNNQVNPKSILNLNSPNIVDSKFNKTFYNQTLIYDRKEITNYYGNLFLKELEVTAQKQPKFPINYKDVTYFIRSLSIVQARLNIIGVKITPEIKKLTMYRMKYINMNKMLISKIDRKRIISLLSALIQRENVLFQSAISKISVKQALKLQSIRASINEFNCSTYRDNAPSAMLKSNV